VQEETELAAREGSRDLGCLSVHMAGHGPWLLAAGNNSLCPLLLAAGVTAAVMRM
jgi:hypothetical protein